MSIRKAKVTDRDALKGILRKAEAFDPEEIDAALELIDEYLKNGPGEYRIYAKTDADKAVQGFVCFGKAALSENAYDLYWIVVHPDFQGQSIGTNLMDFAENHIRKNAGSMVLIETSSSPEYKRALTFYRNKGYSQIARIPDFYSKGDDKLIFSKTL